MSIYLDNNATTPLRPEVWEAMARVEFGGISREACMAYLPEARDGDYVLVHAGFAISKMDEREAERTLADLREMAALSDEEAAAGDVPTGESGAS